ncbi:hypothetical protein ACB098_01G046300 [Castanea mollissima]
MEECMKVGQWEGKAGSYWSFKANKGGISEIIIIHGEAIHSISFKSEDGDGTFEYSDKYGGDDGDRTDKILLDWPREYLTSIAGTIGHVWKHTVIKSLRFYSNRTKFGPYGDERGESFSFPMEGGVIVGFHGRSGVLLDAIGVYAKTFIPPCALSPVTMQKQWDDGVFSAIRELHLHVGDSVIHAIHVLYESRDGKLVWSQKHGGSGGDKIHRIKLDESRDFLVGIVGFYGPVNGNDSFEALRSITFYTNNGKYGPFGDEIGEVVGFHGRSGVYLDAIGVHMEYF